MKTKLLILVTLLLFPMGMLAQSDPVEAQLKAKYKRVKRLGEYEPLGIYYKVKQGKGWGFCDATGKEIVPPIYENGILVGRSYREPNYYIVRQNKRYGFYDATGKGIIPPRYKQPWILRINHGNSFWYCVKNKCFSCEGACDKNGKEIIPPVYKELTYVQTDYINTFVAEIGEDLYVNLGIGLDEDGNVIGQLNPVPINDENFQPTLSADDVKTIFDYAVHNNSRPSFINVIAADPKNAYGYTAEAYNYLGVWHCNREQWKDAKKHFIAALRFSPAPQHAKENLAYAKKQRRSERWSNSLDIISDVVGITNAVVQGVSVISGGTATNVQSTNGTNTSPVNNTNTNTNTSSGSSSSKKVCPICRGSKKCSGYNGKYKCFGTGKCKECGGKGVTYAADGTAITCNICNHTGKCPSCGGSGRCKNCNGTGYK